MRMIGVVHVRRVLPLLIVSALFLANAAFRIGGGAPEELFRYWRSSDDFAIAAGFAGRGEFPVAPYRVRDTVRREKDPRFLAYRERLFQEMTAGQILPLRFWRTLPPLSLSPDRQWRAAERFDDGGRALLLGLCYVALGGAAPYLLFWLGVLLAVPLLALIFLEFSAAGQGWAGAAFILTLSCSTFFLDLLALGYSAVGFHVLALLVLVSLSVYSTLGKVTVRGLVLRSAGVGVLLAVFALARGTVPTLLPAFAVSLGLGLLRATRKGAGTGKKLRVRQASLLGLALLLLTAPYVLMNLAVDSMVRSTMTARGRPMMPRYHDPALLIWKGLGDFDREKGYEFRDKAGERAIISSSETGDAARAQEIHLRTVILTDIREDPLWYATILVKRARSTIFLSKLWPYGPRDGISIVPAASANEGVTDSYYTLAAQADWISLGPWTREVPISFLLLPSVLVLLVALLGRAHPFLAEAGGRARTALPLLVVLALGVLPTPVLITTATALEPQCFVFVHLLALSLAGPIVFDLVKAVRGQRTVRA